ncbi:MAG TPA: D-alanyl-D-alanine carboxypeptidase family protein [Pseudolabrys sp.]|nr:D-alanyl-D-alanine carboxypeptidase family protein [Pseudolabrys sp.]
MACAVAAAIAFGGASRANAEAQLLIDAATGKVLHAENATYPWYPASVTKLMTIYTTLKAVRDGKVTFDTLLTYSKNAAAQPPTKMGFKVGTTVTIDNALKMMMVKSANDIAVAIAEGVGGSIDGFADMMNTNAHALGMTQSNFVNPNGLPAENHQTSARDLAILARALIRDFPQYDMYWHISSIRYGKRIYHNYNKLIDRYPGADGMKTGFICASGYNLVASATRNGRRLIAVILGSYSGAVRSQKAAQLLESGFNNSSLSWLTPSLGTVDQLKPIDAAPPNLRDEMCGGHRRKPASEDNDEEDQSASGDGNPDYQLSALKPANQKYVLSSTPIISPEPIAVFTGPRDHPDAIEQTATAAAKKVHKKKTATAKSDSGSETKSDAKKPAAKKPAAKKEPKKEKSASANQ